jgi:hypothetical protein
LKEKTTNECVFVSGRWRRYFVRADCPTIQVEHGIYQPLTAPEPNFFCGYSKVRIFGGPSLVAASAVRTIQAIRVSGNLSLPEALAKIKAVRGNWNVETESLGMPTAEFVDIDCTSVYGADSLMRILWSMNITCKGVD